MAYYPTKRIVVNKIIGGQPKKRIEIKKRDVAGASVSKFGLYIIYNRVFLPDVFVFLPPAAHQIGADTDICPALIACDEMTSADIKGDLSNTYMR